MRRLLFFVIVGLGGAAILISLGVWQVKRLGWKQEIIAQIGTRMLAPTVALPLNPDPEKDAYLPVVVTGQFAGETLRVLVSQKQVGPGFRLITPFETQDGRIMVDRGFIPAEMAEPALPIGEITVAGNLQWPQETDGFTPNPEPGSRLIFARDLPYMAARLGTKQTLVVARELSPEEVFVTPLPVDTATIPNDHLQYAITWFSLAVVWLVMSLTFLRRRVGQLKG